MKKVSGHNNLSALKLEGKFLAYILDMHEPSINLGDPFSLNFTLRANVPYTSTNHESKYEVFLKFSVFEFSRRLDNLNIYASYLNNMEIEQTVEENITDFFIDNDDKFITYTINSMGDGITYEIMIGNNKFDIVLTDFSYEYETGEILIGPQDECETIVDITTIRIGTRPLTQEEHNQIQARVDGKGLVTKYNGTNMNISNIV